jgi:hypothetical protein
MHGMPQPDKHHRRLEQLVGTWEGKEALSPSPWGPGGEAVGRSTLRLDADGFYLIQDYVEEKDGRVAFRGHGVIGWDGEKKRYAWYWFDSMGFVPRAPTFGTWEGDTLLFQSEVPGMGFGRYTWTIGQGRYRFKIENSRDGETWAQMMEGDYARVGS